MPRLTETRAARALLPASGQIFLWCSEVKGFGCRLTPGARSWIVQVRQLDGSKKRITLGAVGTLSVEGPPDAPGARDLAMAALNAARRGEDSAASIVRKRAPTGTTLNAAWDVYEAAGHPMLRGVGRKRASTVHADRLRWEKYIRRSIGKDPIGSIGTPSVRRFLDTIPSEGQRNQCLILVKSLISFATTRGLAEPARIDIKATASRKLQNFYSADELAHLDRNLVELIEERPDRVLVFSALRLMLLTGARMSEVLSARWSDIDVDRSVLRLERDKTSNTGRDVLLSPAALAVFDSLPRTRHPFVFFSAGKRGHITNLQKPWDEALARAGLRRFRRHDLRHSFASAAISQGVSLYVVGQLLGHRQATTTERYAHLEKDVARQALDKIASAIGPTQPPAKLRLEKRP
jgi:integrase